MGILRLLIFPLLCVLLKGGIQVAFTMRAVLNFQLEKLISNNLIYYALYVISCKLLTNLCNVCSKW